jgi:hypothetical protein
VLYRNHKNGKLYRWIADAVDCTNARDGTAVVVYCPLEQPDVICVRERSEFLAKFIRAEHGGEGEMP